MNVTLTGIEASANDVTIYVRAIKDLPTKLKGKHSQDGEGEIEVIDGKEFVFRTIPLDELGDRSLANELLTVVKGFVVLSN